MTREEADTLKTKTSAKQAEKEIERKCLRQKEKKKEACGKIVKKDKSTQMRELNEKWLP